MGLEIHEDKKKKALVTMALLALFGCGGKSPQQLQNDCQPKAEANAGGDKEIILGFGTSKYVQLGSPAVSGQTYSWSPTNDLDHPDGAMPWASPKKTTTYVLTACTVCGCVKDQAVVSVYAEE